MWSLSVCSPTRSHQSAGLGSSLLSSPRSLFTGGHATVREVTVSPESGTSSSAAAASSGIDFLEDLDMPPIGEKPVNFWDDNDNALDTWLLDASNAAHKHTMQRVNGIKFAMSATAEGVCLLNAVMGADAAPSVVAGPVLPLLLPIKVGNRHPEAPQVVASNVAYMNNLATNAAAIPVGFSSFKRTGDELLALLTSDYMEAYVPLASHATKMRMRAFVDMVVGDRMCLGCSRNNAVAAGNMTCGPCRSKGIKVVDVDQLRNMRFQHIAFIGQLDLVAIAQAYFAV